MNIFKMFFIGIFTIFEMVINFIKYFFIGLFTSIIIIPKYFVIGIMYIFSKDKRSKISNSSKRQKKLSFAMIILSISVYFICVFVISKWSVQEIKVKYLTNDIIKSTEIIEKNDGSITNNAEVDEDNNSNSNAENDSGSSSNSNSNSGSNSNSNSSNRNKYYYPNDYLDYMNVPFMEVDFNKLLEKNPDTVGWIKVEGTKVNYPVVQAEDNNYYLNHAFNKTNNVSGWIYGDFRNNFSDFGKNTIIYGHNMNNKTMFGSIPSMLNSSYLRNSDKYYIKFSTPSTNTIWKVFSIYTIEPQVDYIKTNFYSVDFGEWVNTMKGRSIYDFGVDVGEDDKILTLSTCDNTGTKRVAVHAKMINIEYK